MFDFMHFPHSLVEKLMIHGVPQSFKIVNYLTFEDNLCHECNGTIPKYRYCVEMYGSVFKQNFGWYINKQAYEFGIEPISNRILPESCPQEIQELIKFDKHEAARRYRELAKSDWESAYRISKELEKQERRAWNIIENIVRDKFGYRKIGEEWASETILYKIVRSLYPDMTVLRHYRPDFLQGLEFDIYIKELKVGIEYQGLQHFRPVEYFGGKEAFQKQKERDKKKKRICTKEGIQLIHFKYNEDLSNDFVVFKLKNLTNQI